MIGVSCYITTAIKKDKKEWDNLFNTDIFNTNKKNRNCKSKLVLKRNPQKEQAKKIEQRREKPKFRVPGLDDSLVKTESQTGLM